MPLKSKIIFVAAVLVFSGAALGAAFAAYTSDKTVIAFGADIDQNKVQPIWNTILASNPDVFLFLGDNVYIDSGDEKVMRAQYKKLAENPGYRALLERKIPLMATWDDHDYGKNDAGGDFFAKAKSQQVFLDFFGEPEQSDRRTQQGIYNAKIFGSERKRVQIIALDTRYFRTSKSMLGEAQWKWLEEELQKEAEVRIIMSSIQVITRDNGWENWMNIPRERARLFELIKTTKANGVLFISGDRHRGELAAMDAGIGYPLYDLTTGSLNKAVKEFSAEKNFYRMNKNVESNESFGLITIDWGVFTPPQILLGIKDLVGSDTIERKISLSALQQGVLPLVSAK